MDGNISINSTTSDSLDEIFNPIPVIVSNRAFSRREKRESKSLVRIRRSNKLLEAVQLPVVINLNPRSIYNKVDEFKTMIEQLNCTLCFISESWDRENEGLEEIVNIENFKIIKNVCQRQGSGGKPALLISEKDYFITELSPKVITVPKSVEAVWALMTPKSGGCRSKIKNIAVCAYYYTKNTKKSDFLDHVTEAFNIILAKYGAGTQFIMAGDTNRLKLNSILDLSPNLKQVVNIPTRKNPDATLDTIITSLSSYYQEVTTLPPLDNDSTKKGKPSDHLIVYMKPLSSFEPKSRKQKTVTFRPLTESGLTNFGNWIASQTWDPIFDAVTAHEKAEILQNMLLERINLYLPEKTHKITSDDQPWFSQKLKKLDRQLKREYTKHKKSEKWLKLRENFLKLCSDEKANYYRNIVHDLQTSNPGQWYSKLKRMSSHNLESSEIAVQSLIDMPNQTQAEIIADEFSAVSNEYEKLLKDDITGRNLNEKPIPNMSPYFVHQQIKKMKNCKSTVKGDVPLKVIKLFGYELSFPLSNIFIRCCHAGEYPNLWKLETVTPVPKQYPPKEPKHLRKISGTLNFSKLFEKFLAEAIIEDMLPSSDPSQYGNMRGVSTQHYLINLVNRILTSVDKNNSKESYAAILHLVDWKQAFDRQCPRLGINSFIENGVRNSIIPVLTNYFQDRKMQVKWHGLLSAIRELPGGGPQGCLLGQLMYSSQSNDSGSCVPDEDRFKFVDDLSLLELINLIAIGLSQYDINSHVPSDITVGSFFLPSSKYKSQTILNNVAEWTEAKKMKLNEEKTKFMIFNFTSNYQFDTRLHLNNKIIEKVEHTKLLGTFISSDLTWRKNTQFIIQKAYKRLEIIRKLYEFNVPTQALVNIYTLYVRSVLEFNSCVWHFNITIEESSEIERVQKNSLKLILKDRFISYENALTVTNLQSLEARRTLLCKRFAIKCTKNPRTSNMFPLDNSRHSNKYKVNFARHDRLLYSAIPQMQRMLNTIK